VLSSTHISLVVSDFCSTGIMLKKLARLYKNVQISDKTHIVWRNTKQMIFSFKETFSLELRYASNQHYVSVLGLKYNETEN